jgi:SPP1 gp7 family putative phage head morphogenesis protein
MGDKTAKAPVASKKYERVFAEFAVYMTEQMTQRFENQAIGGLQVNTVEKFTDAQVGNYANVFLTLANRASRKLKKQFSNKRISEFVRSTLSKADNLSKKTLYAPLEKVMGVDIKQLLAKDIAKPQVNALILESIQWTKKLRDETLESFTAGTLRSMSLGKDLDEVMSEFKGTASKRKNHAKFIARNQVANFNAMTNKLRHQKLGITEGIWETSSDERVRECHRVRDGKVFKLSEGLYSSCDGKNLFPGTDYQCRCTYQAIIPEFEDIE